MSRLLDDDSDLIEIGNALRPYVWQWFGPKLRRLKRKRSARETKSARILARQIARSEHHIRARPLLNNGKAWR